MVTESDIRQLLDTYRNTVEALVKMKFGLIAFPELESQVGAPLIARQESRVQAAELTLMAAIKRTHQ